MRAQLKARIALINRPMARSHDTVNMMPFSADGEIFLHCGFSVLWAHKVIAYNPSDRTWREIGLPDNISMKYSQICQISFDIFQYSSLERRTKVYRIQDLNLGAPRRTEVATLDRSMLYFSLAVHLRRHIYMTGGETRGKP